MSNIRFRFFSLSFPPASCSFPSSLLVIIWIILFLIFFFLLFFRLHFLNFFHSLRICLFFFWIFVMVSSVPTKSVVLPESEVFKDSVFSGVSWTFGCLAPLFASISLNSWILWRTSEDSSSWSPKLGGLSGLGLTGKNLPGRETAMWTQRMTSRRKLTLGWSTSWDIWGITGVRLVLVMLLYHLVVFISRQRTSKVITIEFRWQVASGHHIRDQSGSTTTFRVIYIQVINSIEIGRVFAWKCFVCLESISVCGKWL